MRPRWSCRSFLELRGLGLTISEGGGGSELAAIAVHQYHLERAAGAGAFVADRGAVDVLAYARALAQRQAATALDRRLANSVWGFAESWLALRPYDLIVSCQHRFISRRISDAALTYLEDEQRVVLAEVDARIVHLTSAADYRDFLDSVLTVARSDRQ